MHKRVLFVVKRQSEYSTSYSTGRGGLYNSARYCADMLNHEGHWATVAAAVDGNCLDRLVSEEQPSVCVIEALWVTPDKLREVAAMHPRTQFVVRLHSELPFLATEGIAIEWVADYGPNVQIAVNSDRLDRDIGYATGICSVYLPNYYPTSPVRFLNNRNQKELWISSFGALRPLKNTLIQAVAAIEYANLVGERLTFVVNSENADPQVLRNLRSLFSLGDHELWECGWLGRDALRRRLACMDVALQCSLSETFNITTADAVSVGTPVVVSPEVRWVSKFAKADPTDTSSIVKAIGRAVWSSRHGQLLERRNLQLLRAYSTSAKAAWLKALS